jgi:hypothetical protein
MPKLYYGLGNKPKGMVYAGPVQSLKNKQVRRYGEYGIKPTTFDKYGPKLSQHLKKVHEEVMLKKPKNIDEVKKIVKERKKHVVTDSHPNYPFMQIRKDINEIYLSAIDEEAKKEIEYDEEYEDYEEAPEEGDVFEDINLLENEVTSEDYFTEESGEFAEGELVGYENYPLNGLDYKSYEDLLEDLNNSELHINPEDVDDFDKVYEELESFYPNLTDIEIAALTLYEGDVDFNLIFYDKLEENNPEEINPEEKKTTK